MATTPEDKRTYATHGPEGLNDRSWQIETTLQRPGNRKEYLASLKASGMSENEITKAMSDFTWAKHAYHDQEVRNNRAMILANRGGNWTPREAQTPTVSTNGTGAAPMTSTSDFLKWAATPEGQAWSAQQQNYKATANPPNPNQPSWVPDGYTLYGDDKTGVTLPTGTDVFDAMNRGGYMSTIPGANPYFPNGRTSSGNLSLGGSPAETDNPPTTGLYTPPKPPASGAGQSTGSGAANNAGSPSSDQLKAFLEYLAGKAGNASPIVGNPGTQPAYTSRPNGPSYGAVVQKGLL